MPKRAKRLVPCTLCPSTSHKMVVGDATPWKTLHLVLFGRPLRSRLDHGYYSQLWCTKTRLRGVRPAPAPKR